MISEELEAKKLYKMKLNDIIKLSNGWNVIRVPGGWIYEYSENRVPSGYVSLTSVFVPFNEEYKSQNPIKKNIFSFFKK